MKHFTIPIFVPELACPNRCVFCNQQSISGCQKQPEPEDVREIILQHLKTIPVIDSHIEIGFFGGSFTGIEMELQKKYLAVANEFLVPDSNPCQSEETETRWLSGVEITGSEIEADQHSTEPALQSEVETTTSQAKHRYIQGIRLSTRPDYINPEALSLLKQYGVTTIELGAQSLDDSVLKLSGRGHTVADVKNASALILEAGFKLGLQMMTGLPGDTPEKSLQTARLIVELGATCTRIYPTLVIRGTELELRWRRGDYQPQSLDEAVELSAQLLEIFRQGGVEVIRVGLHPSEGLLDSSEMLAGPFHASFRELVETFIWKQKLIPLLQQHPAGSGISVPVQAEELHNAIGYGSSNRIMLEKHFSKVEFVIEVSPDQNRTLIIADKKLPLPAKNVLKTLGEAIFLQTDLMVYKSISGHPDVFMCQGDECLVVAPGLPAEILTRLMDSGIRVITGQSNPGKAYPDSARYNAVVTEEFIIHNLKITDPAITGSFPGRKSLQVNQGYTRCNLLALDNDHFITSGKGIEKALQAVGKTVLFVDPSPVKLRGQKYGFFPGCCGIYKGEVLIAGNTKLHPQSDGIREFIDQAGLTIRELYDGALTDVGGIFVFPPHRAKV